MIDDVEIIPLSPTIDGEQPEHPVGECAEMAEDGPFPVEAAVIVDADRPPDRRTDQGRADEANAGEDGRKPGDGDRKPTRKDSSRRSSAFRRPMIIRTA
jgi:hypothetical protein